MAVYSQISFHSIRYRFHLSMFGEGKWADISISPWVLQCVKIICSSVCRTSATDKENPLPYNRSCFLIRCLCFSLPSLALINCFLNYGSFNITNIDPWVIVQYTKYITSCLFQIIKSIIAEVLMKKGLNVDKKKQNK